MTFAPIQETFIELLRRSVDKRLISSIEILPVYEAMLYFTMLRYRYCLGVGNTQKTIDYLPKILATHLLLSKLILISQEYFALEEFT